ncbi:MAG: DivIVA domain-containing protein [Actinomycetota bacterium]|nr:DivIVA domain-containing protein [Actinomycetota bacterium]
MRTKSNFDRFPIVKRGYDPALVESHLETLIEENDQTLDEAAAQIASLQTDLEESQKHEEAVHLTILAATKTKENMLEVAERQADEARAAGRKQGDGIITDARMQAFQVVTEARKEADGIVAEARAEVGALLRTVETNASAADIPSDRQIALEIRVEELQGVIAAMEAELRSRPIASEANDPSEADTGAPSIEATVITADFGAEETEESEDEDDASDDATAEDHAAVVTDDDIEIVVTDTKPASPNEDALPVDELEDGLAVATTSDLDTDSPTEDSRITDDREADAVRKSFYSRRSAKLPRIGVEAGRSAMAAAAGLRTGLTSDDSKDNPDPDRSQEYETV